MTRPLDGVLVADLTRFGPGPWCAMILGDLGAEVVKVEAPPGGKGRAARLVGEDGVFTDWMEFARRGSRSLAVDIKTPEGADVIRALCERADVVLESFRPGVARRLGLDAAELHRINPRLVYCAITGYGQDGPRATEAGHDLNYLATGGLLGSTVGATGEPAIPGAPIGDFAVGALHAVVGVLAALRDRDVHGAQRRVVDVAMQEGIAHLLAPMVVEYLETGRAQQQSTGFLGGAAPWYHVYRTSDKRFLAVAAVEPWFFDNLCQAMGHPQWAACHLDRTQWPRVCGEMAEVFASATAQEWLDNLRDADTCVTLVRGVADLPDDPQLSHRGLFRERPDAPGRWEPAPLPRLTGMTGEARRPPSRPGQHTDELLAELGVDASRRERLRSAGVVG